MALLPQNQRDQIMVFVAFLGIAAMGLFYQYVWAPKQVALAALEARVGALERSNERIKREVKRGNLAKLRAEGERYRRDLAVMRQIIPTVNEVPRLLEEVSTAARRVGLDLGDVQPEAVVTGTYFDVHRYRIGLAGDYHAVAKFLTNVGTLTRIVAPINLQLTPSQRSLSRVLPKQHRLLEARLQIQTYVARTAGPPQ
jgi:type IV pilus assembly protein PilO